MLKLNGSIKISGDKSISHRALIFASLCTGKVKISNLLESDDVMQTLKILRELGVKIVKRDKDWLVFGNGTGLLNLQSKPFELEFVFGNGGSGTLCQNPEMCT